jgi:enoyl-CoA hydratase
MNYQTLKFDEQNGIWTLTINRPESLNALNSQLLSELESFLIDFSKKDFATARALIITGAGPKAFVAGADIKEMADLTSTQAFEFAQKGQKIFMQLEALKVPVIAAVNGFALGGGLELALACDYIIASETAKLGLPETSLGLIPGFGGTVRLSRIVGLARAREMIYGGEMYSAKEAFDFGLVNHILVPDELLAFCFKKAGTITLKGPVAVASAKKSIAATWDMDLTNAMKEEARIFSELFSTQDQREGTRAFMEKRKAQFKGS